MAQLVQLVLPLPNRTDVGNHWRTSKNSRTLPVEFARKTWCFVLRGKNQLFRITEHFIFSRMGKTSATCCSSHERASREVWQYRCGWIMLTLDTNGKMNMFFEFHQLNTNALLHQFQLMNNKCFWHWWRSWCSLFFHFQTGQISGLIEERRKTRGQCLLTLLGKHGALS